MTGRKGYTVDDYRKCSDAGMTIKEAAQSLGVSLPAVYQQARRYKLKFQGMKPRRAKRVPLIERTPCAPQPPSDPDVIAKIHRMHDAGHPPGVIEMVTGVRRGDVVRVLDA